MNLTEIRTEVSLHLNDPSQLIWTETLLDAAIRAALEALGRALGGAFALEGLDGALETTLDGSHRQVLVAGAVAYALALRVSGRFEDARAGEDLPDRRADWAGIQMARFEKLLGQVRVQSHQTAETAPYDPWDWEEEG